MSFLTSQLELFSPKQLLSILYPSTAKKHDRQALPQSPTDNNILSASETTTNDTINAQSVNQALSLLPSSDTVSKTLVLDTGNNVKTSYHGVLDLAISEIHVDPRRFQYKLIHDSESGQSGSLRGVKAFNPELAGILLVWLDPSDNKVYCINGHNRLWLAKKHNVAKILVRFINAKNDREARVTGAMANIADNNGTAIDAAKLFKDAKMTKEQLEDYGVNLKGTIADQGWYLSKLRNELFEKVTIGELDLNVGYYCGKLPTDKQHEFIKLCGNRTNLSNDVLKEMVDQASCGEQLSILESSLFGQSYSIKYCLLERAELIAYINKKLKTDKNLLKRAVKGKQTLERHNSSVDSDSCNQFVDSADIALTLFNQFKNLAGNLSSKLNEFAYQLATQKNKTQVKNDAVNWVLSELHQLAA